MCFKSCIKAIDYFLTYNNHLLSVRMQVAFSKLHLIWKGKFADPFYFNTLTIDFE